MGYDLFLTMFRNHSYPLTFLYKNKLIQQLAYTVTAMVSWFFFLVSSFLFVESTMRVLQQYNILIVVESNGTGWKR